MKNLLGKLNKYWLVISSIFIFLMIEVSGNVSASESFVTILSPNGGERYVIGKPFEAKWQSSKDCRVGNAASQLKLDFIRTNDRGDSSIYSYWVEDTGRFYLPALPNMQGDDYVLKIYCQNSLSILWSDVSDKPFKISALPVILTSSLPAAKVGKLYKAVITVTDFDTRARVAIDTKGLPDWVSNVSCQNTLVADNGNSIEYKRYTCTYSGVPNIIGSYRLRVIANDGMGEVVSKIIKLTVGR